MNNLSPVFLAAALIVVLLTFAQAKDLYHICSQFDGELRRAVGQSIDPETNFNEAMKLLSKESPIDSRLRSIVAQGWKAVHDSNGCDAAVDSMVSQLYECRPMDHERLRVTLGATITNYVTKCSTKHGHWDDRVSAGEANIRSRLQRVSAKNFINEKFIALYWSKDDDKTQQGGPPGLSGTSCCRPQRAGRPAYANLLLEYDIKYGGSAREYFRKKPSAIDHYVNKWIARPCAKYVYALGPVMSEAKAAAQFYPNGEEAFVEDQGNMFKDALFRYDFCKNLADSNQSTELVEAIKRAQVASE